MPEKNKNKKQKQDSLYGQEKSYLFCANDAPMKTILN